MFSDNQPTTPHGEEERRIKLPTEILPFNENDTADMRRLWNMLATTVPRTGYEPPKDRDTTILSLGCGYSDDGLVLTSYFGGNKFGANNEDVHFIGVDNEPIKINDARRNFSQYPNFDFYVDDARDLKEPGIPEQADVVFVRHPGPYAERDMETWPSFFQTAVNRVDPKGIVFITTFLDEDYGAFKKILSQVDGHDIVLDEVNAFSRFKPGDYYVSPDRYITVLKKRRTS
jgi:Methyltransferase domain